MGKSEDKKTKITYQENILSSLAKGKHHEKMEESFLINQAISYRRPYTSRNIDAAVQRYSTE